MTRSISILGTLFGVILLGGCSHARKSEELRYQTTISYFEGGIGRTAFSVNALIATRRYNHAPGMSGWGTHYHLSGVAIPMPVGGGHIIALLDEQAGMDVSFSQGKKIEVGFSHGWPRERGWIDPWNSLAQSATSEIIKPSIYPRFLFLPTNGGLKDSKVLTEAQLSGFGLSIQDMKITITKAGVTPIPPLFAHLGCTGEINLKKTSEWTSKNQPICNSLVFHGLK